MANLHDNLKTNMAAIVNKGYSADRFCFRRKEMSCFTGHQTSFFLRPLPVDAQMWKVDADILAKRNDIFYLHAFIEEKRTNKINTTHFQSFVFSAITWYVLFSVIMLNPFSFTPSSTMRLQEKSKRYWNLIS